MAEEKPLVKRNIKDSVFIDLFGEPENQLKLYNFLHPKDADVKVEDFKTVTINNVFTDQLYNDLGFTVRDRLLILVEAQSTWSINIIVRIVMYLGQTIKDYIADNDKNVYGSKKIDIPKPEFYVVYTGSDKKDVKGEYSLADEFFNGDREFIDIKVKVLQADKESRDIVTQYITFTKVVADQEKIYGRTEEAITKAIQICKDNDILKEYLEKREKEVISIMTTLFSQEEATKAYGREQQIEGAVGFAKDQKMSDKDIIKYLMNKFNLTEKEAEKYLEPVSA